MLRYDDCDSFEDGGIFKEFNLDGPFHTFCVPFIRFVVAFIRFGDTDCALLCVARHILFTAL